MIKTKKVLLGTLATTALVATPIATVVSCGTKSYSGTSANLMSTLDKDFKAYANNQSNINNNGLNYLMEKDTKGKWKFKDAKKICWDQLEKSKEVSINISLSDLQKQEILNSLKKTLSNYSSSSWYIDWLSLFPSSKTGASHNQDIKNSLLFDTSTDGSNQNNSKVIANKLAELEAKGFILKLNLIIPKWIANKTRARNINMTLENSRIWGIKFEDGAKHIPISLTRQHDAKIKIFKGSIFPDSLVNLKLKFSQQPITFDTTGLPTGLKTLHINNAALTNFKTAGLPQGLKELELQNNKLTSFDAIHLPQELFNLDLSSNNLKSFDTINLPDGLETLNLNRNKLNVFEFNDLPRNIKELNLSFNQIQNFNYGFSNIKKRNNDTSYKKLRELNLSHNKLTKFDPRHLPQGLKELNLSYNNLTTKQPSVDYFKTNHLPKNLKILNLSNNNITIFETKHLPQGLERLNLKKNQLLLACFESIEMWWSAHGKHSEDLILI